MSEHLQKILVIDFLALGDMLFITPLIHTLGENYPDVELIVSIPEQYTEIFRHNPFIDKVIPFDKYGEHKLLKGYTNYIRMLRKEKAELTITLQDNPRLALLAALSGASKRVGFARHWSRKLFYTHPVLPRDKQHRIDYYLDITDQLPEVNNIINEGLEIYIPQNIKNWAEEFLKENDLGKNKIIGFVVGAGWASKEWPESYFLRLGKLILKQDIPLIIFGGKKERKKAERLSGQMGKQVINVAGKTDIMQLAALMSWCELVVAGDTGPMHVAVAAGTRVVSLFGPTEPWRYRPYGNKHEVIYLNQECQPCHEKECKKEKNCLKELSVNRVFERIQRYI